MLRDNAPMPRAHAPFSASDEARASIPVAAAPQRVAPATAIAAAILMVVAISAIDIATGFRIRIGILYLAPVSLVAWAAGRTWGFAFAIASTLGWTASAIALSDFAPSGVVAWDGVVLGATLVLFVELQSRLARALEHSDERFLRVLEGIDAAVYAIDDAGAVLYANRQLSHLVGRGETPTVDAIASHFTAHGERTAGPARPAAWVDGAELASRSGERRYVVQARDIRWVDRRRARLMVLTDVTERHVAQELRLFHQEAMHRTARVVALTEAASGVAHELNQPLEAIVGYNAACIRLLDQGGDPAQVREAMEKCRAQAVRAGGILRQLRELTRRRTPEFGPCNLNVKVRNALAWLEHELDRAHVAVVLDLAPDLPEVRADCVLVEQVVVNLVQNAIDAMQEVPVAGRRLTIRTSTEADGVPRVGVDDRGPGIPAEFEDRLYTSFFTTKKGGLGLGLSICRSIVEMHGGRIGHGPGEHGGASFHFTIPAGGR